MTEQETKAMIYRIERTTEILEAATAREQVMLQEVRALHAKFEKLMELVSTNKSI